MKLVRKILDQLFITLKDKDVILLLIGGPIFLTLLIGGVYLNSYVNDIPIAILDEDNSSMSRMIVQQFKEHERFSVKYFVSSKEELQQKINSRKAYMGVYIPYHFASDVTNLRSAEVLILVDGTNIVVGNNSFAAASTIVQTVAAGVNIKLIEAKGIVPQLATNMGLVFNFNDRTLYDPRLTYMNYMILGFIAVFLQQVMLSGVGISIVKAEEEHVKGSAFSVVLIKVLSCAVFAISATFIAIGIAAMLFKVPIRGNLLIALLMCVIFAFAVSAPAVMIAALVKDRLKFAQIAYMLSLPTFVSCGYVWPQDQIPQAVNVAIKLFWPLVNFARPFDELVFKGVPFSTVSGNIIQLIVYTLFWMPVSILLLKRRYTVTGKNGNIETITA